MRKSLILLVVLIASAASAQVPADALASHLHWRNIGPLRGGRSKAISGVVQQPYTFYMAQVNGGVFKTDDAGRTWNPIFDSQPTASIGAIAVAPSDPNTLYVGSGEGLPRPDLSVGDGVYKSTDAGRTWTHLAALRDAQQIPQIAIDPRNPNRLLVAALGHPYGPNKERGIYMSTDGGATFDAVLQKDENSGGNDVDIDPSNPLIVYANLWEQRQGPWENAAWTGNGGGLYKSVDGGNSWKQLTNGLPTSTNQVNLAISPSNPARLYAAVASNGPPAAVGVYRSDDGGESWTKITNDPRPASRIGGGDLPVPVVNPKDPNTVIMASTVSMKSVDGGVHWVPFKGAPGGDDYQNLWINPNDPNIIGMAADQGVVVTLNGGRTWSSWYNQSTAQMYHVMADNAFPYRLCSGQQESGSACVSSRGAWGEITMREWTTVGVDEYGYVAPDPLDENLVYGGRGVSRFDRRTQQTSLVGPLTGKTFAPGRNPYRQVRTQPVVFSLADPKTLLFANNFLWSTTTGGVTWKQLTPTDPTRATWDIPASVGKYTPEVSVTQRGVIYTIGSSPLSKNVIWFGTDDGKIYRTVDGGQKWQDLTPPHLKPWFKVFMIDAGHFDQNTAYAAINTLRLDIQRPMLLKTKDGGKTWSDISAGVPNGAGPANALREDPKRRGLLYAATERGVYVSFDDGDHWQSLRLNLPASSVRDLIVKDDDIAIATHGRGFWILDDVTALRQMDASTFAKAVVLFKPQDAVRIRWNENTDTPLPIDEPMMENPPDGAIINYYLNGAVSSPVTLTISDSRGRVVRSYASSDSLPWKIPPDSTTPLPRWWYRAPQVLSAGTGMHRFLWDVHYQPLASLARRTNPFGDEALPIAASPANTAPSPNVPFVAPGNYTVTLAVNGQTYSQPLVVKQDPRVKAPAPVLREIYALTDSMYFTMRKLETAISEARASRTQLAGNQTAIDQIFTVLEAPAPPDTSRRGGPQLPPPPGPFIRQSRADEPGPNTLRGTLATLGNTLMMFQNADVPATASQKESVALALKDANTALASWMSLRRRFAR